MSGNAAVSLRFFALIKMLVAITAVASAQTEFDSLKRNSMLDTMYQPSQKPTLVTEHAQLKISGFVQPALYIDNNIVFDNDLFVTSEIPTSKLTDVKFGRFHLSANQSRLGFAFKFPTVGKNTSAFIEGDFLSSSRGLNTFFRLRHAYITWEELVVGQTWTNFGDVNGSPNTLDLEGPNSMPASRVAQIRWRRQVSKQWNLLVALEEPKADYTPLDSASAVKPAYPEFVFKPKYFFRNGYLSTSVVIKSIIYTDKSYSFKKKLFAWGLTSSLNLKIKKNQTFNAFGIVGQGTQGSVNDFGGLGYEAFPKDDNTLETLLYYGGYVSYSVTLRKRWSHTFVGSYLHQNKPSITDNLFKRSYYFSGNGVFAINKFFTVGAELLYGIKKNHDNTEGSAFRMLFLMRLIF